MLASINNLYSPPEQTMRDFIIKLFENHLPETVVIILILLALLIVFTVWCTKTWVRVKNLPCTNHASKIGNHEWRMGSIDTTLSKMSGQLDLLIRLVPLATPPNSSVLSSDTPSLSQKNSPKALNDNGRKVFDAFNCGDFLQNNKDWLLEELAKFSPKTALDVEMSSLSALRIASADDRFNDLKDKIYHSPELKLTLPDGQSTSLAIGLDEVLFVLSLPLRDAYLEIHPELI